MGVKPWHCLEDMQPDCGDCVLMYDVGNMALRLYRYEGIQFYTDWFKPERTALLNPFSADLSQLYWCEYATGASALRRALARKGAL